MGARSRTYKVRLSDEGFALFYDVHGRLGRLVRELLSYGATLYVAVTLLDRLEDREIAGELAAPHLGRLAGGTTCFVGFRQELAERVERIVRRVDASGELAEPVRVGRLYLAALRGLTEAEDGDLLAAWRAAVETEGGDHGAKPGAAGASFMRWRQSSQNENETF